MVEVFARVKPWLEPLLQTASENMLRIMRNTGRVPMGPLFVDGKTMAEVPVIELVRLQHEPRFLGHFPNARRAQRFVHRYSAAGHALPESRMIGTLQQKHFECERVDHNQHGFRNFHRRPNHDSAVAVAGALLHAKANDS